MRTEQEIRDRIKNLKTLLKIGGDEDSIILNSKTRANISIRIKVLTWVLNEYYEEDESHIAEESK